MPAGARAGNHGASTASRQGGDPAESADMACLSPIACLDCGRWEGETRRTYCADARGNGRDSTGGSFMSKRRSTDVGRRNFLKGATLAAGAAALSPTAATAQAAAPQA